MIADRGQLNRRGGKFNYNGCWRWFLPPDFSRWRHGFASHNSRFATTRVRNRRRGKTVRGFVLSLHRLLSCAIVLGITLIGGTLTAHGQDEPEKARGPELGDVDVQHLRVGIVVTADKGLCRGIVGTTPIPINWPEQEVQVIDEEISPFVDRVSYRDLGGTVKQMVVTIRQLPRGSEARAVLTLEIRRRALLAPDDTSDLIVASRRDLDRDVSTYLTPSKGIESTNRRIKDLASEVVAGKEGAWQQVEAIYDYVRENVEYREGSFKGALRALKDGYGDCEELSSLFIAMCRAEDIPARTVWVPGHCYPEFYLQDAEGNGGWFPCQAAGTRSFGGMHETRPILQKGDNFRDKERPREAQRYVSEYLTGAGGKPKVEFIRESVAVD